MKTPAFQPAAAFKPGANIFYRDPTLRRETNSLTAYRVTRTGVTNLVTGHRMTFKRFPELATALACNAWAFLADEQPEPAEANARPQA